MAFYDRMNQATMNTNPFGFMGRQLNEFNRVNQPPSKFGAQNAYAQAVPEQAQNYDEIMEGYRGMMGPGNDGGFGNVISRIEKELGQGGGEYQEAKYNEAPEWAESYGKLRDLTDTGGLNEQEQGSLRARAISPIRAVYDNMTRNMDRQKRLQGGFSPNYNASATRMAREGSEQIAQSTTNANAAIAEMVQKGKLAMAPELANMASGKNSLVNEMAMQNATNRLKHGEGKGNLLAELNKATQGKNTRQLDALGGMTSLYGTTPALVDTFGKQVSQNRQQLENETQGRAIRRNQPRQITSGAPRGGGM